jgi:hypothetical protein
MEQNKKLTMIEKLNNLLIRGGLISPYNEEQTGHLVEACRHYLVEEDFDENFFSKIVALYVEGGYDEDLQKFVLEFIVENYNEDSNMPSCVWQTLTFFVIYLSLKENDDAEMQAIYSCSLQNRLIECKGRWKILRFQKELVELFYYMDSYMEDKYEIKDVCSIDVLKQIYSENGFQGQVISSNTALALKFIGQNAWEFRMNSFLNSSKVKEEKNPYIRAVTVLEYVFINKPWFYMPVDLKYLLKETFSRPINKALPLRTILKSIIDIGIVLVEEVNSNSSKILQILEKGEIPEDSYLDERFMPNEFMVYLYNELLLEAKLKVYGTE